MARQKGSSTGLKSLLKREGRKQQSFPHRYEDRRRGDSRGRKPERTGSLKGLPVVAAALVLMVALGVIWREVTAAPKTLAYHLVLLLDRSDPLTETQQQELRSIMQSVEWGTPDGGKVSVFYLDNMSGSYLEPVASAVAPPRHQGNLFGNERIAEQRFRRDFLPVISDAVMDVQNATDVKGTAIAEIVAKICRRPDFSDAVARRKILIFSDMLQNSGLCSEHAREQERKCTPGKIGRALPDLKDVEVDMLYLRRDAYKKLQTREHEGMWITLLQNADARVRLDDVY
ncbi:hypothetical protein N1030_00560 [Desulfovibrio mangrovi]|uniref:hypothetical protein n=1 Tax=Desulfovibrio mangrovi TaxID=2976983 RepID=UPI00224809CF|nr:hypothetical protein [Desulfovibrio mangrovi]UZP67492.1 hypothetical protein N1030_00560 [Desulfovibrio mangrovi]